jgi:hypothetical protein
MKKPESPYQTDCGLLGLMPVNNITKPARVNNPGRRSFEIQYEIFFMVVFLLGKSNKKNEPEVALLP